MALVDYVSSSEEASSDEDHAGNHSTTTVAELPEQPRNTLKRKHTPDPSSLPPLPSKFHDLYASNVRASTRDDPSMHGGRKRITPHVEGNWPTHLYIEWYPGPTEHKLLSSFIHSLRHLPLYKDKINIESHLTSDLGSPLPLHISLSRPIGFSTATKDAFLVSLQSAISSSAIRPFHITFTGCDWVSNFEATRWFLVLRLARPDDDNLNKLLQVCNDTVQNYGQPPLYASPAPAAPSSPTPQNSAAPSPSPSPSPSPPIPTSSPDDLSAAFHISIAWSLTSPPASLAALTSLPELTTLNTTPSPHLAAEIKAKIGNTVTSIPLPTARTDRKALFGF